MKKSSAIEQKMAALRQQLTQAKRHERRAAERQFLKLARSLGIYGLPADQLQREFDSCTHVPVNQTSPSTNGVCGGEE